MTTFRPPELETGRPMTNTNHNVVTSVDSSFERVLELGLASRLTIIAGPDTGACGEALDDWLNGHGLESLLIQCHDETDSTACHRRIVDAFASAGIIEDSAEEVASDEHCQSKLVQLINGLAALPGDLVVVLLDYQPNDTSDRIISFILEHLPQQVHLFLVSEDVPGLSCIPRLRVRRQLQLIDTRAS